MLRGGTVRQARQDALEAARELEALGDLEGTARALRTAGVASFTEGYASNALDAFERALELAERTGDVRTAGTSRDMLGDVLLVGNMPLGETNARIGELLVAARDDRRARAMLTGALAMGLALTGAFEDARRLLERRRATLEELGLSEALAFLIYAEASVEVLVGDYEAAERWIRKSSSILQRQGQTGYLSTHLGILAEIRYRRGDVVEASQLARRCEELAADDDIMSQSSWRRTRALLCLQEGPGKGDEAVEMVRGALALVDGTEHFLERFLCRLTFAEVLLALGRAEEAVEFATAARGLAKAKEATVLEERAESVLRQASAP